MTGDECKECHKDLVDQIKTKLGLGWFWKIAGSLVTAALIGMGFSINYAMQAHDKVQALALSNARTDTQVENMGKMLEKMQNTLEKIEDLIRKESK